MSNFVISRDMFDTSVTSESWSDEDAAELNELLESAMEQVKPYDGVFTADWLLTDITALVWHTTKKGKGSKIDGKWIGTDKMNWIHMMPDGAMSSDPKHSVLLSTLQKLSFLLRAGLLTGDPVGNRHWKEVSINLINFAKYMTVNEDKYHPSKYALNLLDQDGLNDFTEKYAKGGFGLALEVPQRLLSYFYESAFNEKCPSELHDTLFSLDGGLCRAVYDWALAQPRLFRKINSGTYKGLRKFSHTALANIACCSVDVLSQPKMLAFLRQFEIELHVSDLLVTAGTKTKFPSHKTPLLRDALDDTLTTDAVWAVTNQISLALAAHRHLPGFSPNPKYLSIKEARVLAERITSEAGRTPLMPIDIGLKYLNGALSMIHNYGDLVVDLYLEYLQAGLTVDSDVDHVSWAEKRDQFKELLSKDKYSVIRTKFGITKYHSNALSRDIDNDPMDLHGLLGLVIASCVILIGILKPSRDEEIIELKRDCLEYRENDGYYLYFSLGKSNTGEAYEDALKPIPFITAESIKLMQKLGNGIDERIGGNTSNSLFNIPIKGIGNVRKVKKNTINRKLDDFGDFLEIRKDAHGRRWYVRIHEMRKFFLLLFFWQGRFNVLDAARDIAGHTDVSHIYRYMEANYPRQSFTDIEADYAIECLSSVDKYYEFECDGDGLEKLAEMVCDHFKVTSLDLIPESEWSDYVRELRNDDAFSLHPHSIQTSKDGLVSTIPVSFVIREAA
ncbi:MAG: hypothetical protein ABW072_08595 [Sedimenticola sp.]